MGLVLEKKDSEKRALRIHLNQLIPSTEFQRNFAVHKSKAASEPVFILEHNQVKFVFMGIEYFKEMNQRLNELEEEVLVSRLEKLERDPSSGVSWSEIRRTSPAD